jgi:predicted nucleic acid-binding protein
MLNFPLSPTETHQGLKPALRAVHFFLDSAGIASTDSELDGGRAVWRARAVELPRICEVVWLGETDLLSRAARIGHGSGISMADALILASLLAVDVDKVYSTDTDLGRFRGGPPVVIL